MPVTTPQGTQYSGIDPNRTGRFGFWPVTDARQEWKRWAQARRAEKQFAVQLRRIAQHIGAIVKGMFSHDHSTWPDIAEVLYTYSHTIEPWAEAVAARMLADVSHRDAQIWQEHGREIGRRLHQEIATAPIGPVFAKMQRSQVELITSLPREEGDLIHALARQAMIAGRRWTELVPEITERLLQPREEAVIPEAVENALAKAKEEAASTGSEELRLPESVVKWFNDAGGRARRRANLIARTEAGRAAANFQAVRAVQVGSEGYIWRTAKDRDVRPRHRVLEGTFHRWDEAEGQGPIASEPGQKVMRYHPGAGPNCRCFAEVVLPGGFQGEQRLPRNPEYLEALRQANLITSIEVSPP